MRRPALALTLLLATAATAQARPGDVDRRYGTRGLAHTKLVEGATVATLGPGGRLVAAGGTFVPSVAELTPRGRLDRRVGVRRFREAASSVPLAIARAGAQVRLAVGATDPTTPALQLLETTRTRSYLRFPDPVPFPGPLSGGALLPGGGGAAFTYAGTVRTVGPDAGGAATLDVCRALGSTRCTIHALATRRDGTLVAGVTTKRSRLLVELTPTGQVRRRTALPLRPEGLHVARDGAVLVATGVGGTRLARVRAGRVRVTRLPAGAPMAITSDATGRAYVLRERYAGVTRAYVAQVTPRGRLVRHFGRRGLAGPAPRLSRDEAIGGRALVLDGRGGLLVAGKRFLEGDGGGFDDPAQGCDFREDTCAAEVHLAAWRLRLR